MKKILITGKNGMLATDFIKIFDSKYQIFAFGKEEMDVTHYNQCDKIISTIRPDLLLNFSAYTDVEKAEGEWMQENYAINHRAVENLAKITKIYNVDFITISTDYVFDGKKKDGYNECDIPNPINHYGRAKLLGEQWAKTENENTVIVRTSWLFGGNKNHKNFVNTMLRLAHEKKEISVVNDQFGLPTFTEDLLYAIEWVFLNIKENRGKIFHFSNFSEKSISWCDALKTISSS